MDEFARILARLTEADPSLSAREAAEVFWLAGHIDGFRSVPGQVPNPGKPGLPRARKPESEPGYRREADSDRPDDGAGPSGDDPTVWYTRTGGPENPPNGFDALPLRLSHTRELPRPLDLQRGLRPLLRTVNSGPDLVLDEETTVRDSADARAVVPALVKSSERWLDLALVIDTGPSMILWDRLIAEFRRMLTRLGAFRVVRTWYLRSDGKAAAISSGRAGGSPRAVKELVDPSGRQAILVVTDCVGELWRTGEAVGALDVWARSGPLAIVQPLTQRLWPRSAVACHRVQLAAPYPGAPNHRLVVDPGRRSRASRPEDGPAMAGDAEAGASPGQKSGVEATVADTSRAGIPVPILEMTPRWLAAWARLVCGTSPVNGMAAFTGAPPAADGRDASSPQKHDPVRVVERFMASASPQAFKLAGLIAAAPLHLPLMRQIQRVMLHDPRPVQLAEIYLGGLLRSVSARGPGNEVLNDVFDFLDGVREVLLGTIRKTEAIKVMNLVSAERGKAYGNGEDVHIAWVETPGGTAASRHMTSADQFYGTIEARVLRWMGLDEVKDPQAVPDKEDTRQLVSVGRPATEPAPAQASPLEAALVAPPGQTPRYSEVAAGRLEHGITMLGTPSSGKTTLLAALGPALTQRGDQWRLVPTDDGSAQTLISMITHLTAEQAFPTATLIGGLVNHNWQFLGENRRPRWLPFLKPKQVRVDLHVADPSGEIFSRKTGREEELIDTLVRSRGIIFMFDPIREFEYGDAFAYVLNVVTRLALRMMGPDVSHAGRLPHYVSVCVSKFDDSRVFEAAEKKEKITNWPADPYRFPRVADADARDFFAQLCEVSKSGTARMAMDTVERFFRPERIRYFVTSAIGFYVDRRTGIFSPDDYVNTLGKTRIRGPIHPINVAEPFIWLSGRIAADSPES